MQVELLSLAKTTIALEGRNLDEIVQLLGVGMIRWIRELDPRAPATGERKVEVEEIKVSIQTKK